VFSKSHLKFVAAATLGTLGLVQSSNAALLIDLRFTDGTHNYSIPSPGNTAPITINAWAQVTGTSGNAAEEGLQSAMLALKSAIVSAGITGSITSASLGSSWNGSGSGLGVASNLSADSIGDWGNSANNTIGSGISSFFRARTTKSQNNQVDWGDANSAGTFNNLADGGAEFLVGSFTFTPTAAALGAILNYVPVVPLGGTTGPSGWFEDTADKTAGSPTGSKNQSNGSFGPATPNAAGVGAVTITVLPEPTTLGLAGLMGLGLLRRKRA